MRRKKRLLALSPFFVSLEKRYVLCRCFAARSTVRVSCTVVVRKKRLLALSPFFLSLEKRHVLSPCFAARSTVRVSCATRMTLASFVFSFSLSLSSSFSLSLSLSSSFSLSFFSLVFHGAPSLSYKPGQLKRSPYGHGRISFAPSIE